MWLRFFVPIFSNDSQPSAEKMRMQPTRPRTLIVQTSSRTASEMALDSRQLTYVRRMTKNCTP